MNIRLIWWTVIATLASKRLCGFKTKFTNLQCDEFDKPFATFKTCRLKALSRHQVSLNVHVQLHQVPVNNVTINAQLLRKGYDNGYKPFMYNNTADFCQFLKSSSRYMFWKIIFFKIVRPISNINHSCPFDQNKAHVNNIAFLVFYYSSQSPAHKTSIYPNSIMPYEPRASSFLY
ncbi:uncharacterized protein LOC106095155 [Stomoxys calcitrans]|uniref:uncharacterized protein LOC106095155 n=1 Tax=Stomoxys calcitrans TaxID=35570 RepID=UPI0027E2B605|nr:uncharacterized protein LOC106095155 [Stomoxys calcitrans]